jgi:hypothetical protein
VRPGLVEFRLAIRPTATVEIAARRGLSAGVVGRRIATARREKQSAGQERHEDASNSKTTHCCLPPRAQMIRFAMISNDLMIRDLSSRGIDAADRAALPG